MFKIEATTQLFLIVIMAWLVCGVVTVAMMTLVPLIISGIVSFFYMLVLIDE